MLQIKVWNQKEAKFEVITYKTPSFVLDEARFGFMVQGEHIQSTWQGLNDKANKAGAAYAKAVDEAEKNPTDENVAKRDKLAKRSAEAEQAFGAFVKAAGAEFPKDAEADENVWTVCGDNWVALFTIAFGLQGGGVDVDVFSKVHEKAVRYLNQYHGSQEWTQDRKDAKKALQDTMNAYVDAVRPEDEDADELYKSFTPEFSSQAVDRFLDKAAPTVGKVRASGVIGMALMDSTATTCFKYMLNELFYKYGCAVSAEKKQKARKRCQF